MATVANLSWIILLLFAWNGCCWVTSSKVILEMVKPEVLNVLLGIQIQWPWQCSIFLLHTPWICTASWWASKAWGLLSFEVFVIAVLNLAPNDIISQSCMYITIVLLILSVGVIGNTCSMLSLGRWPRVMRHSQSLRNYQHAQRACLSWWVSLLHESSHLYTALHNSSVGQSLLSLFQSYRTQLWQMLLLFSLAASWADYYHVNILLWYVSRCQESELFPNS